MGKNWKKFQRKNKFYHNMKWNEKSASTTIKEMLNLDKEKNARTKIVKPKIFNLSDKMFSRYQANNLLRGLKFTPTPKCNNTELKSKI